MQRNHLFNAGVPPMQGREMLNRETFGGNSGEQGVFDPADPSMKQQAVQRLSQLTSQYGDMLVPGYTGETGFAPNDANSYYSWQNGVTEAQNILRSLKGQNPLTIKSGGPNASSNIDDTGSMPDSIQALDNKVLRRRVW
jgi:hypothetical protein